MGSIVDVLKKNIIQRLERVKENVEGGGDVHVEIDHAIEYIGKMCDELDTTVRDLVNSLW